MDDAPPSEGPTIQITGTIRQAGTQAAASGAIVDVVRTSDGMVLATMSTDIEGMYSVSVPTHRALVDAYLDVTYTGHLRTRAYLVPQLSADSRADAFVITGPGLQEYATAAHVPQPANSGFILAQLFESNQQATGATASMSPARRVCYSDPSTQLPDCTLTATADDGLVWIFAVPPATATVSGQLADMVRLRSRQVNVEANMFIQLGLEP